MKKPEKKWSIVLALIYLAFILFITLFSREPSMKRSIRMSVFLPYIQWLKGNNVQGRMIIKNIALFVPLGYFMISSFPSSAIAGLNRKRVICVSAIIGATIPLFVETAQYYTGRGIFDTADLLNNVIGTITGIFLFLFIDRIWNGRALPKAIVSILLICAGFAGCFLITEEVRSSNTFIDQFDFAVYDVKMDDALTFSGFCKTWYIETPPYRLYFKSEDGTIFSLDTNIENDTFTCLTEKPIVGKCEILIEFQGFKRLSTLTYINGDHVEYVEGEIQEPKGIDLSGAILKAYIPTYDTFVYQRGNCLVWLIGCELNDDTRIIYQLRTNEPEKLPIKRVQYGFDNRGFKPGGKNEKGTLEHYRIFEASLPEEYNITAVTVGFGLGKRVLWSKRFRVVHSEFSAER